MSSMYRRRDILEIDYETFDAERADYTTRELEAFADSLLKKDRRESGQSWNILNADQYRDRQSTEVYNDTGIADPTLTVALENPEHPGRYSGDGQKMYWRRHPRGRKVNSSEQRKDKGAGYYKG